MLPLLCALLAGCGPAKTPDTELPAVGTTGVASGVAGGTPSGASSGTAVGTPTSWPQLPAPTWEVTGVWSAWSSPQLVDLDRDGVLDVVTGHGTESPNDPLDTLGEVRAHSGADGSVLWQRTARQEVFASALFAELGGSVGVDVVIGGRHGELMALDGSTGAVLWQWPDDVIEARAAGWYNFYTAAPLPDLDGDGVIELLLANGGDNLAQPGDPRPPGRLAVLDGATGAVDSTATMPDGAETYCSPRVDGDRVFFCSGGETEPGSLWVTDLATLRSGDLSTATRLVDGAAKGVIGPAALADLTGDGVPDPVVQTYAATVVATDGDAGTELWSAPLPGHESHGMPILAELTGDGVLDVFVSANQGTFPAFTGMTHRALDGATGAELWSGPAGVFGTSGGVAVDLDGDGLDEVIFGVNDGTLGGPLNWQPWLFDPVDRSLHALAPPFARSGVSAPWVGDLDDDGRLELVLLTADLGEGSTWRLARYDLDDAVPATITTPHYVGGGP